MSAQETRSGSGNSIFRAGADFSACRCVWNQSQEGREIDRALEERADALLRGAEPDAQYPAYTEAQFARHGEGKRLPLDDGFLENVLAVATRKEWLDEIYFLAGLACLSGAEKIVLTAALAGDTQEESRRRFVPALAQQQVSRLLRSALNKCYATDLSFSRFSSHTIYRRPARRRHMERGGRCLRCGDWFAYGSGAGRYCSERCRGFRG